VHEDGHQVFATGQQEGVVEWGIPRVVRAVLVGAVGIEVRLVQPITIARKAFVGLASHGVDVELPPQAEDTIPLPGVVAQT
jgi:hypothetical protein